MKQAVEAVEGCWKSQNKDHLSPLAASTASSHRRVGLVGSFSLKQKFCLLRNEAGVTYEINVPQQPVLFGAFRYYSEYVLAQMPVGMILQGEEDNAGKAQTRNCRM